MNDVETREMETVEGGAWWGAVVSAAIAVAYAATCVGIGIYEGITSSSTSAGDKYCN
jgi:hypothetical protein